MEGTSDRKYSCRPALFTTALFLSIIILDLFRQEYPSIIGHSLLAAVAILLTHVLCQNGLGFVAWGLLFTPFLLLFIGWMIVLIERNANHPPIPYTPPKQISQSPDVPTIHPTKGESSCCPPAPSPYKHYI